MATPQPHDGAGAAQPQLGAGAGQQRGAGAGQQRGAGAGQQAGAGAGQQAGAGAGQQAGAGAGQQRGAGAGQQAGAAGAQQSLAFFARSLANNPPPLQPESFFACNLAKRPCRPPHPPQSAIATDPKLTAKAANANDANRTLFIKIFLPRELNMDPRNATMYFLKYGPNLPETSLALRAALAAVVYYGGRLCRLGALRKIGKLEAYQTHFRCQQPILPQCQHSGDSCEC